MAPSSYLRTAIDRNWAFKVAGKDDHSLLPVAGFPTVIHLDLLHHGKIPEPSKDQNSQEVQWVGETTWLYRTTFETPNVSHSSSGKPMEVLVFDGLDTYATVVLNGQKLFESANMFLQYRLDVTGKLRDNDKNTLELLFDSALLVGKRLEKEQGFKNLFWNGDSSRMNVRKIGCHFGWDWAPTLLTCGPWRPIYLESFFSRIADVAIDVEVSDLLDWAHVNVAVELDDKTSEPIPVHIRIYDPRGEEIISIDSTTGKTDFMIRNPQLWYPIGYGNQPLYSVSAFIEHDGQQVSRQFGVRLLELVQRAMPGQPGTSFFFKVNNVPIFCRGSNWVPGDTFLSRMTPERYRQWVQLAADGNQNMIRVWGGGLYEDDALYDACDELGILIWHDFMLGCGVYPVNDFMLKTIRAEAEYNIRRTRHHPCIVLWCGNNEDHMFAELHHLEYDIHDKDPENWLKTNWAARYYYDKMLKDICEDLVPRIPYHNSSPYGGSYSNDATIGDVHAWRVWMADQPRYPYQDYGNLAGRFVSEFGMKSYPALRSIKQLISDPKERHPQSRTFDLWHCAPEDQRTISLYLIDNQRTGTSLEDYVYATQLNQAEAMDYALRAFRRLWKGPGAELCAGSLIWQLNDCFPSVSWSLADSFVRRKLAYYIAKRDYAPIIVGLARKVVEQPKDEFTKVYVERTTYADVWVSNLTIETKELVLSLTFFSISDGTVLSTSRRNVTLLPNRSVGLESIAFDKGWSEPPDNTVASAHLYDGDTVVARFVDWPQPLRHLDLSSAKINVKVLPEKPVANTLKVAVSIEKGVAKGVELYIDTEDPTTADACIFSDNCLDLVPRDEQIVWVTVDRGSQVSLDSLTFAEQHYGSVKR